VQWRTGPAIPGNVALRLGFLLYLFALLLLVRADLFVSMAPVGRHTAVVDLDGLIAADAPANADDVIEGLTQAFESPGVAGVVLRVNSPGGSPVQAGRINTAVRRLRGEHPKVPLYAVVEDLCASGGYYVAVSATEIYADKASIVGSIGVRMDSFGFVETLEKVGVERRLITAGAHKGFLDPFSPLDPADEDHAKALLANVHEQFIQVVREGRGERLKDAPELYSGWVWTGEQALDLGLVDALGDVDFVAREVIGAKDIVNYTRRPGYFDQFVRRFGARIAAGAVEALAQQGAPLR
jgi:protease IV